MKQSSEAFWWSLFSAGGVLSALFLPALVMASMLQPKLWGDHHTAAWDKMLATVSWWPVRIALFAVIFLSFFHAAHRIRHVVMDLGWRHATAPLAMACYGGAIAGTGVAAYLLVIL